MLPHAATSFRYGLAATALGLALLTPPAPADAASLSLHLQPRNAQEARALGAAITIYAIRRDLRSGADIRQTGQNHLVQMHQSGGHNRGIIRQRGANHAASLSQTGGGNAQVILQYGNGARADIRQTGGQAGILLQFAP